MTQEGPAFPYDYDAAPTPTIPGGPRRLRPASPIMIPQARQSSSPSSPIPQQPREEPPRLERKRSAKSSRSAYRGNTGRLDYGLHDKTRELPPLPAFIREPATSPTKETPASSSQSTPQPAKERPGFFRRVFGSSRNSPVASAPEPPVSHGSTTSSAETANHPSKTHHIASQMKSPHLPSPREPPPSPKDHAHVLSTKSSSFFRRRKKSAAEPEPVPVPLAAPPALLANEHDGPSIPSPDEQFAKSYESVLANTGQEPH